MNRYITLLLLGVVAVAMLLVFFVHTSGTRAPESAQDNAPVASKPAPPSVPEISPLENAKNDAAAANETKPSSAHNAGSSATPSNAESDPKPSSTNTAATLPDKDKAANKPDGSAKQEGSSATEKTSAKENVNANKAQPEKASVSTQKGSDTTQPPATASTKQGAGKMLAAGLHFRDAGMYLTLEADGPMPVKYFILSQPERLVVDLPGAWQGLKAPDIPSNNIVKAARIGRQGNADRLVLDLSGPLKKHELKRISDTKIELYFEQ